MWITAVQRLALGVSLGRGHRGVASMNADLAYYRRRIAEEAAAAAAASDLRVRAVHLELARRYAERCAAIEGEMPRLLLVPAA